MSAHEHVYSGLLEIVKRAVGDGVGLVDPRRRLSDYGVGSVAAVALVRELSAAVGRPLPNTLAWQAASIDELVRAAAGKRRLPDAGPVAALRGAQNESELAIVGMACRFPGAPSLDAFWRLLARGQESIADVPADRWDVDAHYDPDRLAPGKMNTRRGGFLPGIDAFDPLAFGISAREAPHLDPQQRLFLELAWEALEDAGLPIDGLKGSDAGVFCGAMSSDYARLLRGDASLIGEHTATGFDTSIIAARVSYTFGLQGPSWTVNTACSSGLVAVHQASQSLRLGECNMALAGAVNVILAPESTVAMAKFGGLAADGRCKAFDARANGYVRSEGGAIIVLKTLAAALQDGDPIWCILRASSVNNDGYSNGLTAPNPAAQERMLQVAYARAGVDPGRVHYVEAHGTGTALGDPIEVSALGRILGQATTRRDPLLVGSVKTNIGHLEAAAGLAGLVKVALSVHHRQVPKSLHFVTPNPQIPFDSANVEVVAEARAWPHPEEPGVAGVSSFGFGGTNCHVVVEEAPSARATIGVLSAGTRDALAEGARKMHTAILLEDRVSFRTVCRDSLLVADGSAAWQASVIARSQEELLVKLVALERAETLQRSSGSPGPLAFVFSGNGAQWRKMARQLLHSAPAFRVQVQACERVLQTIWGRSLVAELTSGRSDAEPMPIDVAQIGLFALQIGLSAVWSDWGIRPDVVVGHSVGEVAAAFVAGALGLEDALRVVVERSRLQQTASGRGSMLWIPSPAEDVAELIRNTDPALTLATENSPNESVVAGTHAALQRLAAECEKRGLGARLLPVDVAYHSPDMDPAAAALPRALDGIRPRAALIPIVSSVTGTLVEGHELTPEYWARNVREPVLFSTAMRTAAERGVRALVEVAPHSVLLESIRECTKASRPLVVPSMRRHHEPFFTLLGSLSELHAAGFSPRWLEVARACGGRLDEGDSPPSDPCRNALEPSQPVVLPLSAHTDEALRDLARRMARSLDVSREAVDDVCYSAAVRRTHRAHRLAVVATSRRDIRDALDAFAQGDAHDGLCYGESHASVAQPVFVFSGQGGHWPGMGRRLLSTSDGYRRSLEKSSAILRGYLGWSVYELLLSDQPLAGVDVVQPVVFSIQVALAEMWKEVGVVPSLVLGQSLGEVAAAHVAGALDLRDACRVIACRSRLLARLSGLGAMLVVGLASDEAQAVIGGREEDVSVAVEASPDTTVLSGTKEVLSAIHAELVSKNVFCQHVDVDVASHSRQVDAILGDLRTDLDGITPRTCDIPFISTVTGEIIDGARLDAEYWVQNVRSRVRFSRGVGVALALQRTTFVELSAHPTAQRHIEHTALAAGKEVTSVPSLRRDEHCRLVALKGLGTLYCRGLALEWAAAFPPARRTTRLPSYPWQRRSFWLPFREQSALAETAFAARPERDTTQPAHEPSVYRLTWAKSETPSSKPDATGGGVWLVSGAAGCLVDAVADALSARGVRAVVVVSDVEQGSYTNRADCLAKHCRGDRLAGVVYVAPEATHPVPDDGWQEDVIRSTLHVRAWAEALRGKTGARLWIVTRGVHATHPRAEALAHGPLWGFARALSLEHSAIWGGIADIADEQDLRRGAAALAERFVGPADEDQLVFRDGSVWCCRLRRADIPPESPFRPLARGDGSYVVSGGAGGVGRQVVAALVEAGAGAVVALGRRSAAEVEPFASPTVWYRSVDVADRAGLAVVFDEIGQRLPPVRGIFHVAGTLRLEEVTALNEDGLRSVLRPKVMGGYNLHCLSQALDLESFVLFSSCSSLWGAAGQSAYAAANHYLDTLAHHRRGLGLPALSVNFGLLEDGRVLSDQARRAVEEIGILPMRSDRALEVLARVDASGETQRAIAEVDWKRLRPVYEAQRARRLFEHVAAASEPAASVSAFQGLGSEEAKLLASSTIRGAVADLLGLERVSDVSLQEGFFRMGMNSLMVVKFAEQLRRTLGCELSTTAVFDYPTVDSLARFISSKLNDSQRKARINTSFVGAAAPSEEEGEILDALAKKLKLA